jgi:SAM-dependent methyltransferase
MAGRPRQRIYHQLALHFDEIFLPLRRPLNEARRKILWPRMMTVRRACDLACGTGTTAIELASRGIETYAVDLSPDMCRLAREKARKAGVALRVIRADMRSFRLPRHVDLVLCEGDALNHVPERRDLGRVLEAVFEALAPGGLFYFDVNHERGFERYWAGEFWVERSGLVAAMHNGHDLRSKRAWSDVDLFVREGHLWKRLRERVEEVSWSRPEIRQALGGAGFARIVCRDAAPFFGGYPDFGPGCRSIFLARKPGPAA